MYVEGCSCEHFCSSCNENYTTYVRVFVDLVIQHEMRMRHIHLWPAELYVIFPRYLINGTILGKKESLDVECVF